MTGAPLRVLVTVLGLDQHEAGALAVSRLLRDRGAEVVYAGRFQVPQTIAAAAIQEDVDVVGVSAHSWEVIHFAEELAERLSHADPPIPVVVGGSVITEADRREVVELGVDAAVAPTATADDIWATFRELAERRRAVAG